MVPTAGLFRFLLVLSLPGLMVMAGCSAHADPSAESPPPANIVPGADPGLFMVGHPEQFPLAAAVERPATSELVVTGAVNPDIARNVPVFSLAYGRVVGIHARLGDTVEKRSGTTEINFGDKQASVFVAMEVSAVASTQLKAATLS